MNRVAVIMQPTYLPWIGYFDLMDQCDIFVLLDSVQFNKRSWQQRNRIKTEQGSLWLTVPVLSKGRRLQKIHEVEIDRECDFQHKHVATVMNAYARSPYLRMYLKDFERIITKGHQYLADLNIDLIEWLRDILGIKTPVLRSSSLKVEGIKTELLVAICQAVGATEYLSPVGSRGYIEENNLFLTKNIRLVYHAYQHPNYQQLHGSFMPYLSILDLLLNESGNSLMTIRSGRAAHLQAVELTAD